MSSKPPRIPIATYRIQFGHEATFSEIERAVPYLAQLGISDIYASPLFKVASSDNPYAIVNPQQLDPTLGSDEAFEQFSHTLQQHRMGLILDIVPNHLCIASADNLWWNDVLENGPVAHHATTFDIDWSSSHPEQKNKVLLPVLDNHFGKVLENGAIQVTYEAGSFFIDYFFRKFPTDPKSWPLILDHALDTLPLDEEDPARLELESIRWTAHQLPSTTEPNRVAERYREKKILKHRLNDLMAGSPACAGAVAQALLRINGVQGDPHSFDLLEQFLDGQPYRLSYWRVANDEINYRRFFDINDLAGTRMEHPATFHETHQLILELIAAGHVTGLRIDHVDGLADPSDYLNALRNQTTHPVYTIVEKILTGAEKLRPDWPIDGTTGYETLALINGLFVDTSSRKPFHHLYAELTGWHEPIDHHIAQCKRLILDVALTSEFHVLSRKLERLAKRHRYTRDFTLDSLQKALADVIAYFSVYRSYIRPDQGEIADEDRRLIVTAVYQAQRRNPATSASVFDFIREVLLLEAPTDLSEAEKKMRRSFVHAFQQLTSPVMAKGVEDTAFYQYFPLASLNEVGSHFGEFGTTIDTFHSHNQERLEQWPNTLVTTSTHDTKRSEDVRARLNVLSEIPLLWQAALARWQELNRGQKGDVAGSFAPCNSDEYLLYQTLIGTWPLEGPIDETYVQRIVRYMEKAMREAKAHTSWINPNEPYEQEVQRFIQTLLTPHADNLFLDDFQSFVQPIIQTGLLNSLSQLTLKMTIPGVPDIYQGNEVWQFTLVDPDNRQPIDFEKLQQLAQTCMEATDLTPLLDNPRDGAIKWVVTHRALQIRERLPTLFQQGEYLPLRVAGTRDQHVIAFARRLDDQCLLCLVGRLFTYLPATPTKEEAWADTEVVLSPQLPAGTYRDVFTRATFSLDPAQQPALAISHLFHALPIALLERIES